MASKRPGLSRAGSSIAVANKTIVLVTGGNTGIGYEIVKSLAESRADFQILLGCRKVHKGEAAAASMGAPLNVNPIQLDIQDDKSIEHCYKAIEQTFGRLDILINNAGTLGLDLERELEAAAKSESEGGPPLAKPATQREVWHHVLDVNVVSTGVLTEQMIPLLNLSRSPKVIFVSSTLGSIQKCLKDGKLDCPELPHYNASKAAVNMLTVQYALRYPHFRVNASCPGLRATGLNDLQLSEELDPSLGAVNVVRLATDKNNGPTGTFTNTEGTILW